MFDNMVLRTLESTDFDFTSIKQSCKSELASVMYYCSITFEIKTVKHPSFFVEEIADHNDTYKHYGNWDTRCDYFVCLL